MFFMTLWAKQEHPATLSHNIITGLLRNELGFDGVIDCDG